MGTMYFENRLYHTYAVSFTHIFLGFPEESCTYLTYREASRWQINRFFNCKISWSHEKRTQLSKP